MHQKTSSMCRQNPIYVFKTSIKSEEDLMRLEPVLNHHPEIEEWSVDVQDVDCVLRVVSGSLKEGELIKLLNTHGYYCAELI